MNADMRQFYHLTGKLEARVESLEKNLSLRSFSPIFL
jgi:hypothetical protein